MIYRIDSVHQGDLDGKNGVYRIPHPTLMPTALALRGVREKPARLELSAWN